MRMRTKKHLETRLEKCADLQINDPEEAKGNWNKIFQNNNPVYLEIGCGKGTFIKKNAEMFPGINFVAMEKDRNVIISAMEPIKKENIKNVKFICDNADLLDEYFDENECERIYLNFSDPQPKSGYKKKRLTHEKYLSMYKRILKHGAGIHQKTDNKGFFEFSLNSLADSGFLLKNISLDLHVDNPAESSETNPAENIMTEYEMKFIEMGLPIYRLEAVNNK